jgi:hypothetical protein
LLRVYRWTRIVTRQRRNITNKTLRQRSSSPSSVALFQHHQRMEITFHNLYLILEVAHSTVIFLTVLGYWRNSFSRKATFLPGWSQRYKNATSSSQSCWPLRNINISNNNWSFSFIRDRNCLHFARTWVHPEFMEGSVLLILLDFCVIILCVQMFWIPYDLSLFAYNGVQNILCFVFALFSFVLYALCCHVLWIVLFWFGILYRLFTHYIRIVTGPTTGSY